MCADELEEDGGASRYRFYAYFAAFVVSLYGHRPGVITNMLLKEVAQAKETGSPKEGYIINVSEHKTAHVFGAAQLYLLPEEFGWIERWVAMRPKIKPKAQNDLVFFTAGKFPVKNLNAYFQQAWKEMGLPGKPSFTDMRTAVSAHGKNIHTPQVRAEMTTYMCHDEATADKFYALSLNMVQSKEMRQRFEVTLKMGQDVSGDEEGPEPRVEPDQAPSAPRKRTWKRPSTPRSSSSEEEEKVSYQESSSSSPERSDRTDSPTEESPKAKTHEYPGSPKARCPKTKVSTRHYHAR